MHYIAMVLHHTYYIGSYYAGFYELCNLRFPLGRWADAMKDTDLRRYYTTEEVAELLRVGPNHVRTLILRGKIPATRFVDNGNWLVLRKYVDELLEANAIPAPLDRRGRRKPAPVLAAARRRGNPRIRTIRKGATK